MSEQTKDTICVFGGMRNVNILDTANAVLSFGDSKIYPKEFNLKVRVSKNASLEKVIEKIEALEKEIYDHFMGLHNVHFTTCRQHWKRFDGEGEETVFQATVSATLVHIISALDEFTSLHIKP